MKWEDIKVGDRFVLVDGFEAVEFGKCPAGTIVETTVFDGDWNFKLVTNTEFEVNSDFFYKSEFEKGSVIPYTPQSPAKFKSVLYDTTYDSEIEAICDLVLTDYFDHKVVFNDGDLGDMLFKTLTHEQKLDLVKWILMIEEVKASL